MLPIIALVLSAPTADLSTWQKLPETTSVQFADQRATITRDRWGFLLAPQAASDGTLSATFTISDPAKQFSYFGETWSVWPDTTYPDQGYDIGMLVRSSKERGYRIQLSQRYQDLALVKYPDGGFVRSVPCMVPTQKPIRVEVQYQGVMLVVRIDGEEKLRYHDPMLPITTGTVGVGASSMAKVQISDVQLGTTTAIPVPAAVNHTPQLRVRKWLGDRQWVFDGAEPIILLPSAKEPFCQNVKLQPGYKPQLMWNAFWDIANQGAYPDGTNRSTDPIVRGEGKSITADWNARQKDGKFTTQTSLTIGFDSHRGTYTYDITSSLQVGEQPFEFRYGYDFEHHTPLDPFQWQHLIVRRKNGQIVRRPLYPIDPGVMTDVESYRGQRVWYGRHNEAMQIAPTVEYDIDPTMNAPRQLNTAVCAAFYDTGVSFAPEKAAPGTVVRVRYRYTGYPASEAKGLFESAKVYDTPTLDPNHHYIFAEEWPKLTFSKFLPMSEPWAGKTPFMTGHNQRPTYGLVRNTGRGAGFAMQLGPNAFGAAQLPLPGTLSTGDWLISGWVKRNNLHGPGGRLELAAIDAKSGKVTRSETYHFGAGSGDWERFSYRTSIPSGASALQLGLRNPGTGELLIGEIEFAPLKDSSVSYPTATDRPAPMLAPRLEGALADYRLVEERGSYSYDFAQGPFGFLELANLDWVQDGGHRALRFAEPMPNRKDYPKQGNIDRAYLNHQAYKDRDTLPFALAGFHGGSITVPAFTIGAWIKPAPKMGKSQHGGKGDIVGVGARRVILRLLGDQAPYRLSACINVNDSITAEAPIQADQWVHVAAMGEPQADGRWKIDLFIDGKRIGTGLTDKHRGPLNMPPSLILGAELFYLHDAYYRGLIGPVTVFDRVLNAEQLERLRSMR